MSRVMPQASPTWERAVAAVGALLLVGLGLLLFAEDDRPPSLSTTVRDVAAGPEATFVVTARVRNGGGETVEDVLVTGELQDAGGAVVETAEATIGFLPAGGAETVGLVFTRDPAGYEVVVIPRGWTDT